jgi:hypothetical protein
MAEQKFHLDSVPSVNDALELYGFLCPILKMLPYDVYLRVDIQNTGLLLETDRHYFDDTYKLTPRGGPGRVTELDSEYVASISGSRGYPVDAGSLHRSRQQLREEGMLRKKAVRAFMSRYANSAILKSAFNSDIKWEVDAGESTILVLTSDNGGDFKRLGKRIASQFRGVKPSS